MIDKVVSRINWAGDLDTFIVLKLGYQSTFTEELLLKDTPNKGHSYVIDLIPL